MISYTADRIGCELLDDALIAGIGNESIGYVMFMRGTTNDTGANEPPYFEFDSQWNGGTNIVQSVVLSTNLISISTNLESGNELFEISLNASANDVEQLALQLRAIFAGHESKLTIRMP